jgi:uncharacterized protein YjbI with pentapeptide repeats
MPWFTTAAIISAVVVGGGLTALWLATAWADANTSGPGAADAAIVSVRLDAIKTALTVSAGLGAGVTLLIALRRQSISERAQRYAEQAQEFTQAASDRSHQLAVDDARERRITDLYVSAAELLGSDKAPVRLSGLYALERLGNDNPRFRQTVVNVICAYLRMPFVPPAEAHLADRPYDPPDPTEADASETDAAPDGSARREELQVRLAAQRLLSEHLRVPPESDEEPASYWRDDTGRRMNLDLSGAVLVSLALDHCQPGNVDLRDAHLYGVSVLSGARFHGFLYLQGAVCERILYLQNATFHGDVSLAGGQFVHVKLMEAEFLSNAYLGSADYIGMELDQTRCHGELWLSSARFAEDLRIYRSRLRGGVFLNGLTVDGNLIIVECQVDGKADLTFVTVNGSTDLSSTRFQEPVQMGGSRFQTGVKMEAAQAKQWEGLPPGWTVKPEQQDGLHLVTADEPAQGRS